MSDNKRYYWLKLNENFFEDDTIQWIEEQENGKDYVIFYLKLCLKSLKDDGRLIRYVGERLMPYDVKALSRLTNTSADTVAVAMKTFQEIGLVEMLETGELYMKQINEMIGSETEVAKRVRKHRAKQTLINQEKNKMLHCNTEVTKCNTEIDKEIDKDIELEKDKELPSDKPTKPVRHRYGTYSKVLLSDEDMEKLRKEFPNDLDERIERLDEYIASTGKKYKSHLATIRSWARRDKERASVKQYGRAKQNELQPYWTKQEVNSNQPNENNISDDNLKQEMKKLFGG